MESLGSVSEYLSASVDTLFDTLVKLDEAYSVKLINYVTQKLSQHVVLRHLESPQTQSPPSSRVQWENLLQGFSNSLQSSDLSTSTLNWLALISLMESVEKCLLGEHNEETFGFIVEVFVTLSKIPELQDNEIQRIVLELHQEASTQVLICQYRNRGITSEKLCEAHPLSEFCDRIKAFVSSLVAERFVAKLSDEHTSLTLNENHNSGEDIPREEMNLPPTVEYIQTPQPNPQEPVVVLIDPSCEGGQDTTAVESSVSSEAFEDEDNNHVEVSQGKEKVDSSIQPSSPEPTEEPEHVHTVQSSSANYLSPVNATPRKVKKWSTAEVNTLIMGVERFGVGKWTKILNTYQFNNRKGVDLHRKWQRLISSDSSLREQFRTPAKKTLKDQTRMQFWTDAEESNLRKGVKKFGVGKWKAILKNYKFNNRSGKNLCWKWRHMNAISKARWSHTEVNNLIKGVQQFGLGKWTRIINAYQFNNRTGNDLRVKWRVLSMTGAATHGNSVSKTDLESSDSDVSMDNSLLSENEGQSSVASTSSEEQQQLCDTESKKYVRT